MFFLSSYDHFQRKLIIIAKSQGFFPWLFSLSWEQRKFSELYEKVSRKNDLTYGKDDIISVANMYFKPDSYITEDSYLLTYNVFELGDIAFEGNKSKNFAHGRFVENTIGNGIVSHVFDVFRPIMKEYDLQFWKYAINNERIMGSVLVRCTKASTMMTNLVASDFLNESVLVPSYDEQKKIGAFLLSLDDLITLHQHEPLFLVMLFSGGSCVFKSAWEQRKLSDLVERGSTFGAEKELPRVEYEDIISGTGKLNKDIYTKVSNKAGLKFRAGDVLYGKLRPYLKNWLLPSFSGLAVGDFWVLQPQNIDSRFLYSLIQSDRFDEVANQSTGTKMPRADWNLVSKTEFAIPSSMKEQGQIGQFLLDLDNLITLHQREHKSNFRRKTNVKQSTRDRPFLLLLCSVDKGLQRGSGP